MEYMPPHDMQKSLAKVPPASYETSLKKMNELGLETHPSFGGRESGRPPHLQRPAHAPEEDTTDPHNPSSSSAAAPGELRTDAPTSNLDENSNGGCPLVPSDDLWNEKQLFDFFLNN